MSIFTLLLLLWHMFTETPSNTVMVEQAEMQEIIVKPDAAA